jgi:ABC-type multidrug transport system ATPase subunit
MGSVVTHSLDTEQTPARPSLSARSIEFRHGSRVTLRAASLHVDRGECVGLIGPNGAGKTTLLRVLAGLAAPSSGHTARFGVKGLSPALRRRIAFLPDDAALFDELSGRENLFLFARIRHAPADSACALAAALGLTDAQLDAAADTYSFGMRRKLALAQTLVGWPELLLLDEPTIGLDANARDRVAAVLFEHKQRGASIVASNDLRFVQDSCDRVLFLDTGTIRLEGKPTELLAPLRSHISFLVTTARPFKPLVLPAAEVRVIDERSVLIRSSQGVTVLPVLVDALLRSDNVIETVAVRPPDLSDVFRQVTGSEWIPPGAAS